MVRRYEEPIEVRAGVGRPQAFVWRGRHYAVRRVLGHWQERRAWWRDALETRPQPAGLLGGALERRVWRVEASAGRLAGTGVYDLAADPGTRQWCLLRVAD